ncbi:hypothetical protein LJY25_03415 [Hymenobacter sp. BT175]|uniref:hypothetical protein n=1 Tax=Hymenobacter translucens TaxID=2886507 RepID=UPI001D0DEDFC|nr:hypothetical protein [Hymenobacter translucens]MCC2545479.1 hypothetical protein [Hymenobacter translucens]
MSKFAAVTPYPRYAQGRNEDVVWLDKPVVIGTNPDDASQVFVALGISRSVKPRTAEAIIIDLESAVGKRTLMLGRLWKFVPDFGLTFNQENLKQLASTYDLVLV